MKTIEMIAWYMNTPFKSGTNVVLMPDDRRTCEAWKKRLRL